MASPHICGLLAYYLSLQPAEGSEYSVAPITPEKLKSNLISIATVGALSDIPKDTPNLLAWNGGGCSNYSAIVEAGSYTAKSRAQDKSASWSVSQLEKAIEHDFKVVSGEVVKGASSFSEKVEKFSERLHDMVEEELNEFLGELNA